MVRRQFIKLATLAGATGLASLAISETTGHDHAVPAERDIQRGASPTVAESLAALNA